MFVFQRVISGIEKVADVLKTLGNKLPSYKPTLKLKNWHTIRFNIVHLGKGQTRAQMGFEILERLSRTGSEKCFLDEALHHSDTMVRT